MADNNTIDLRRLIRSIRKLKKAYIASIIVFAAAATTYCLMKQPQYEIKATLLIESQDDDAPALSGTMGMMMRTFSAGGFGSASVDNELQIINSHKVLVAAAKEVGLNITYTERDGLRKRMLYDDSHITVTGSEAVFDTLRTGMRMRVELNGNKADIKVTRGIMRKVIAELNDTELPATVGTPYGDFQVKANGPLRNQKQTIEVSINGYEAAADFLDKEIRVDKADKLSDAVSFEMLYPNRERGMAILNALMDAYNNRRLERKHTSAAEEAEFLDERIATIFGQLSEAEGRIKDLKSRNKTVNMSAEAPLLVEQALTAKTELVKAEAESMYLEEVMRSLNDQTKADELLPVFDQEAYPMIRDYNNLLIEKRRLLQSGSEKNPAVSAATENLKEMRESVIKNVESMLRATQSMLRSQQSLAGKADKSLASLPEVERDYIVLERERSLKNALYLYLADKRESALLQLSSRTKPGFVVDEAFCSIKPSKRKAIIVCGICALTALLLPTIAAIGMTKRNNRITDSSDLAFCGMEKNCYGTVNALRSRLIKEPQIRKVFLTGDAARTVGEDLLKSLEKTGRKAITTAEDADQDMLLSEDFGKLMKDATENGLTAMTITSTTNAAEEAAPLIDETSLLIVAVTAGKADRRIVKRLSETVDPSRIAVIIRSEA